MDEGLQCHRGGGGNLADLHQRQLPRQHHLGEAHLLQQPHLLHSPVVGLGAGMQGNGRQIEFQQAHILHYQGIGARLIQLVGQPLGRLKLLVLQYGVEGHIDMGTKAMSKAAQRLNLGQRIAHCRPGAKTRPPDIDGIGTMTDRLHAKLAILGRRQQLQRTLARGRHKRGVSHDGYRHKGKIGAGV